MLMLRRFQRQLRRIMREKAARRTFLEGLGFGLILLTIGSAWLLISRETAMEDWKILARKYALTVVQSVHQSMVSADLILTNINDTVRENRLATPDAVRSALATAQTFEMLKARMAIAPQVDVTTIVALNGDVINFSRSFPPPPINLADRDYFKALQSDDKLDVFLSVPVRNRGTGTWTFYLARKIRAPDGSMLGALLTGLHSFYFSDYFERVALANGSAVSLFRQDGVLMARYPEREGLIGASFADQPAFRDVILKGLDESIITEASRLAEKGSSSRRIVSPVAVPGYPLIVNVTIDQSLVLARWKESAVWISGTLLLVFLLLLSLTWRASELVLEKSQAMVSMEEARVRADRASFELLRLSRLSTMQEMSSAIAHELNQPLAAATNYIAVAHRQLGGSPEFDRPRSMMDRANEQILRAGDIIKRLRNFISRGQGEEVECDVRDLISGAISFSLIREQHKEIDLAVQVERQLPRVTIDRIQIQQVLLNLIRNAIEAMAARPERRLTISAHRGGSDTIEIAVADTGPGLDEAVKERLFQPFTTSKERGMGVGLSICRTIIEAHGGTIGAAETEGGGTTFTFTLPLDRRPA